jgi:hypothetical protein
MISPRSSLSALLITHNLRISPGGALTPL